jgi:hypothetical protein
MPKLPSTNRTPTETPTAEQRRARVDRLPDPDDQATVEVLGEVDTTQPIDRRDHGAPLVPARIDDARALANGVDRAAKLARNVTHQRKAAALLAETQQVGRLQDLLIEVGNHHDANDLAPDDVKRRIVEAVRVWVVGEATAAAQEWAKDRGVNGS